MPAAKLDGVSRDWARDLPVCDRPAGFIVARTPRSSSTYDRSHPMSDHGRTTTPLGAPGKAGSPAPPRRRRGLSGVGVIGVACVLGATASVVWALSLDQGGHGGGTAAAPDARPAPKPVASERSPRPDPTLPAVPPGRVKRFRVDVLMHSTKVAADQPPLRVWSFGVDGRFLRGTGVSPPMVVDQGDTVDVTFVNGSSAAMHVDMPHSLDMHAAEIAPNIAFKTIAPAATTHYRFVARNPGVFMYHCASAPMVYHLGAGMAGMFVVKPRHLPKVDRELWLVKQEYFLGKAPGGDPDYAKML